MERWEGYVEIASVPHWLIDTGGAGRPTLLLHGGLGDSAEMLGPFGDALAHNHRLVAIDRRGHGRTRDTGGDFHFATFMADTAAAIRQLGLGPADIVGWSDGGIIALLLAREQPELVRRIVPIGANFHFSAVPDAANLLPPDSPFYRHMEDRYAAISPDGRAHFAGVAQRVMAMWGSEPTLAASDLSTITAPTLVMAGDRDIVTLAHTCAMFEAIPGGELAIVPGTTHAAHLEKPALAAGMIADFLAAPDRI